MLGEILVFAENVWFWVVGDQCPICQRYAWSWCHDCPALRGLSNKEAVAKITSTVRVILQDEPADRFVHTAHEAIDKLDEAFAERNGAELSQEKPKGVE